MSTAEPSLYVANPSTTSRTNANLRDSAPRWLFSQIGNTVGTSNLVATGLWLHLMDELLNTPEDERIDWIRNFDSAIEEEEEEIKHARTRLYPSVPTKPIPHSLPLESYCGTYSNSGYQSIKIELKVPSDRLPMRNKSAQVLFTRFDRSDIAGFYFEHISSEHFLAWEVGEDRTNGPADDASRAEFVVGADGVPARFGMDLEGEMKGEKIWFDRVKS